MKLLISSIFLSLIFPLSASNELALTVPPLLKEQPIIDSIYRVGSHIIVITAGDNEAWRLDEAKNCLIPFVSDAGEKNIAVSENGSSELIASLIGEEIYLKYVNQSERNIHIPVPEKGHFRISANDDFTYLIFQHKIVEISIKRTTRIINLKEILPSRMMNMIPRAAAATKDELLLGFDYGEWGGHLFSVKIEKDGLASKSKELLSENVCAINKDSKGNVWIAGSLMRAGSFEGAIYFYDGHTITPVVKESDFKKAKEDESFITNAPRLDGITINSNDEAVIAGRHAGLFSYTIGGPIKQLWKGSLYISYEMPGYEVGSSPMGIVEKGNKLYVASSSIGVLCFEKTAEGRYIPIKQITFDKKSTNKKNAVQGRS